MGMHYIAFPSYEFESFEMDDTLVGENPSLSTTLTIIERRL